ncbi:unnamed protein product [Rhizopus stolonifer]
MSKINQEEQKSLKEAFNLYDTKHKGVITTNQLMNILKDLGIVGADEKRIEETVKNDKKNNGEIDYETFVNIMTELVSSSPVSSPTEERNPIRPEKGSYSRKMSRHEVDELKKCFEKFDKNGDGQITEKELKEVMKELEEGLSEEEIKDMMEDADTNKDGHIDFEEFKKLMP